MNATGKGGFQPGESGNPAGRPKKEKELTSALKVRVDKNALAERIIGLAMEKGDVRALIYIYDRIDGKPAAYVEVESADTERIMTFWQGIRGEADRIKETDGDPISVSDRDPEDPDS